MATPRRFGPIKPSDMDVRQEKLVNPMTRYDQWLSSLPLVPPVKRGEKQQRVLLPPLPVRVTPLANLRAAKRSASGTTSLGVVSGSDPERSRTTFVHVLPVKEYERLSCSGQFVSLRIAWT